MIFHVSKRPIRTDLQEIKFALEHSGDCLIGSIANEVQIDLRFVDGMMRREKTFASCETSGELRPRLFQLRLDDMMTRKRALIACCHEMVHVEQLINGKLAKTKQNIFWKNIEYKSDMEYSRLPWEIEAHDLELGLYYSVITQLRLKKKSKKLFDLRKRF